MEQVARRRWEEIVAYGGVPKVKKKGLSEPLLSYAALRLVRIFVFEFRIACRVFSGLNPK